MSRIENGVTRPGPRRLEGIATALGLTVRELEVRSAQRSAAPTQPDDRPPANRDHESTKDRMRRIQGEFGRRQTQAVTQGAAFNSAHDRARDDFFLALIEGARGVAGLPTSPSERSTGHEPQPGPMAEAAVRHRVAADALAAALASGAGARVVDHETDGEAAYGAVVAAAMLAPIPAGRPEVDPQARATARATRALLGGGTTAGGRPA